MKKLMFAAALAVTAGVACAVETYDFKASVKHTYIKEKSFSRVFNANLGSTQRLYVKYTKSASIKGYLIQDNEATLTQTATATISGADVQPRNRCFLVALNKSAESNFRRARIIPGVLEAKWWNPKLNNANTAPAEGYLYLGGEMTAAFGTGTTFGNARDPAWGATYVARTAADWTRIITDGASTPASEAICIDDYWFTSCYLFGRFNQPAWAGNNIAEFADCWMNGAGFGKARAGDTDACCGQVTGGGVVLDSLSGNLKAGIYLCSENGENAAHTIGLDRTGLAEDQLWIGVAENDSPLRTTLYGFGGLQTLDVWADGNLDLRTTDVGSGTWSIKRTTKLRPAEVLTPAELAWIAAAGGAAPANTDLLVRTIKGAMSTVDSRAALFGDPVRENALIDGSFFAAYLAE